jgi:hypothetical protein
MRHTTMCRSQRWYLLGHSCHGGSAPARFVLPRRGFALRHSQSSRHSCHPPRRLCIGRSRPAVFGSSTELHLVSIVTERCSQKHRKILPDPEFGSIRLKDLAIWPDQGRAEGNQTSTRPSTTTCTYNNEIWAWRRHVSWGPARTEEPTSHSHLHQLPSPTSSPERSALLSNRRARSAASASRTRPS